MRCKNCGSEIKEGAKFCEECGTAVPAGKVPVISPENTAEKTPEKPVRKRKKKEQNEPIEGKKITENITLCSDGKYRWVYEMSLLKNLSVFFLVWKIFFCIFLVGFLVINISDAINFSDYYPDRLIGNLKFFGYFLIGMTVVCMLGYLLYGAMNGFKYCVVFEMDDKGVNHKQMPKTAKKSELISLITVLAGIAAKNPTTVGIGLNAQRTEMYSEFAKTKKVILYPRRGLIKVNGLLSHNQVFTEKEDFGFVSDYILERVPKKK